MNNKTFSCSDNGFSIMFPNGMTLSTRFGHGNYCENKDDDQMLVSMKSTFESIDSNDVFKWCAEHKE